MSELQFHYSGLFALFLSLYFVTRRNRLIHKTLVSVYISERKTWLRCKTGVSVRRVCGHCDMTDGPVRFFLSSSGAGARDHLPGRQWALLLLLQTHAVRLVLREG